MYKLERPICTILETVSVVLACLCPSALYYMFLHLCKLLKRFKSQSSAAPPKKKKSNLDYVRLFHP
ncbi:hypothetical protein BVRB_5g116580 [Beta vulgaris subsp. vulgaris]|nr:hypothetical protein BVRB_5g116580 [Beta vulgaris subsp. vulgaris]